MASSSSFTSGARWSTLGEPGMTSPVGALMTSSAGVSTSPRAPSAVESGSKLRNDVIPTHSGQPMGLPNIRELSASQSVCTKVLHVVLVTAAVVLAVVSGVWAAYYMTQSTGDTQVSYPQPKVATQTEEGFTISYAPIQGSAPDAADDGDVPASPDHPEKVAMGHGKVTPTPTNSAIGVVADAAADGDAPASPDHPEKVAMDEDGEWRRVVVVAVVLTVIAVMAVLAVAFVVHKLLLKRKSLDTPCASDIITTQRQLAGDLV